MAKPTKKVKFLIDVEVKAQGEVTFSAKAGEVKELAYASAQRWLKRNMATDIIQAKAEPKADKKPAPKKKADAKPKASKKKSAK